LILIGIEDADTKGRLMAGWENHKIRRMRKSGDEPSDILTK
jgi:hypothetical protein